MNNQQYQNSKVLQSTLRHMLTLDLPESRLNRYLTICGSHGCVAGETAQNLGMLKGLSTKGEKITVISDLHNSFEDVFGFSEDFSRPLYIAQGDVFGTSISGSLYERLDYVDQQLIDYEIANNLETE